MATVEDLCACDVKVVIMHPSNVTLCLKVSYIAIAMFM